MPGHTLSSAVSLSTPCVTVTAVAAGAPWWAWIGGALGAYYVVINITFAYRLGAGTAVAVFVCSQLCTSIVLDLTGLVGFQKRAFSW
jgi:transporter family-2 protein